MVEGEKEKKRNQGSWLDLVGTGETRRIQMHPLTGRAEERTQRRADRVVGGGQERRMGGQAEARRGEAGADRAERVAGGWENHTQIKTLERKQTKGTVA